MNDRYTRIRSELILTRNEILQRLAEKKSYLCHGENQLVSTLSDEKVSEINYYLQEELNDVNRALVKMKLGLYGFCEETGDKIPDEQLEIIPTARTIRDVSFNQKFIQSHIYH